MNRRDFLICMGAVAMAAPGVALAADEIILTLRGAFGKAKADGALALTLADLDALPQTRFTTRTPWHSEAVEFSGVSLADFLKAMEAPASVRKLKLVALNDYLVDGDIAELADGGALLANRLNGKPISVSDKGPIFMIFPFDSRAELQHQTYYSRSVWQLAEIELVP